MIRFSYSSGALRAILTLALSVQFMGCTEALPSARIQQGSNPNLSPAESDAARARAAANEAQREVHQLQQTVKDLRAAVARIEASEAICREASMKAERALKRKYSKPAVVAEKPPTEPTSHEGAHPTKPGEFPEYSQSDAPKPAAHGAPTAATTPPTSAIPPAKVEHGH